MTRTDNGHEAVSSHIDDHAAALKGDVPFIDLVYIAVGVLRTGQFFMKDVQAKTIVDALLQNTPQTIIPF